MSQEKQAPATLADDATLPPPPRSEGPATLGSPHDATLVNPPPAPPQHAAPLAGPTTAAQNRDVTIAAPGEAEPPLATLPLASAAPLSPHDATLNPDDPQVKAFHESARQAGKGPAITTGASFGHYELIAPIAKGGMGIVYKARQRNLNRIVAIKMILAGQFADQTDVDRFYAEAEAAAALSHPNIVAIHEIGEVQGQHFFSMDYIEGKSLAGLVQESPLPPKRAAEMLRTIAETMQYAHDSGIIHRDLKPSNVLLDKKQRPLITDFGLAKHVTNQSQITMVGAVVGTPSYMPPEQAAGKGDQVGPWSDLYSLGAILYEVLTGRPPFRAATPFETIRQVLETEPVSPSLVNPGLPRDIETICLKCLQKERSKRYATAQELADELGRFIRGEPIQARPISQAARFWRLCKRNPVSASAIAFGVFMLIGLAGVSTVAYIQTSAALAKSDESLQDAMAAVEEYFTRVSEDTLLNEPGMQPLRKDLLELALRYYEKFLKQRANDPRVEDELAQSLFRVGVVTEVLQSVEDALPHYQKARDMQVHLLSQRPNDPHRLKALGNTLNALGTVAVKVKDFITARREFAEAIRIRSQLVAAEVENAEYQRILANTHMNIGMAQCKAGDLDEGRKSFEQARSIHIGALQRDPKNSKLKRDLGKCYINLGNLDQAEALDGWMQHAEEHFKSATELFEQLAVSTSADLDNEYHLALCYWRVGDVVSDDRVDERRTWYQKALGRFKPLAQGNPAVIKYQAELAAVLLNVFQLESQVGNSAAARVALEQARDIYLALAQRFPDELWYQRDLAVSLRELAKVQDTAGEYDTARKNLEEAIRILEGLVSGNPQEAEYAEALEQTKAVMLTGGQKAGSSSVP